MARPMCPAGEMLTEWLTKQGKSQQWLADEVGVARAVMWRWLVGETTPHIDSAARVGQLTGIPARLWSTTEDLRSVDTSPTEAA